MRKGGYFWQPKGRNGRPGRIWWVKYYVNGRPIRESTGTDKETLARRMLQERVGRAAAGLPVLPRADRIFCIREATVWDVKGARPERGPSGSDA